jgi:glycosyltransferase involved in cell wall biosynthesis
MKTIRYIIDGQVLQTNAWHRGMGKYTLKVLQELDRTTPNNAKLTIVFNDTLSKDKERFKTIQFLCPSIEQVHYELPITAQEAATVEQYTDAITQAINVDFPDDDNYFLIASLFSFDFFAAFPRHCKKLLLFYDLTPLVLWRDLGGYFPPELYMKRFETIFEAQRIFSISDTTKNDLIKILGIPETNIQNINGGFTKISDSPRKPSSFVVPERYVLFPSGDLPHKNNQTAIRGYELYCKSYGRDLPLLITSHFSDHSKALLHKLSDNIIFTENVSDEELEWLYEHSEVVIFASKYEGLGMPILDAVANDKPIVTSQISVFQEMSERAFYYFDVHDPQTLCGALHKAVLRTGFIKKQATYPAIMRKYSWSNTVKSLWAGIESPLPKKQVQPEFKTRIAVVALHPGIANQIGRTAEVLYASLKDEYAIDYYFDANGHHYLDIERPTFLDHVDCRVLDISKFNFKQYANYERVIFLLDSQAFPSRAAQLAGIMPGLAIVLQTALAQVTNQNFVKLVLENQYAVLPLAQALQNNSQILRKELAKPQVASRLVDAEIIIKAGGSNRAIIRRLLEVQAKDD